MINWSYFDLFFHMFTTQLSWSWIWLQSWPNRVRNMVWPLENDFFIKWLGAGSEKNFPDPDPNYRNNSFCGSDDRFRKNPNLDRIIKFWITFSDNRVMWRLPFFWLYAKSCPEYLLRLPAEKDKNLCFQACSLKLIFFMFLSCIPIFLKLGGRGLSQRPNLGHP